MAKAKSDRQPAKTGPYLYPSRFGSHKSMVVKENEDGTCVCKDEFGEYETELNRIDNGLADPNRYRESRLQKLFDRHVDKDDK